MHISVVLVQEVNVLNVFVFPAPLFDIGSDVEGSECKSFLLTCFACSLSTCVWICSDGFVACLTYQSGLSVSLTQFTTVQSDNLWKFYLKVLFKSVNYCG